MYRVPILLFVLAMAMIGIAQQAVPLPQKAVAIRQKIDNLSPNAAVTVIRVDSEEEFGNFVSSDEEEFTFYDVDRKAMSP
jgi:hypothetical protein